jgi:hypothetical protein
MRNRRSGYDGEVATVPCRNDQGHRSALSVVAAPDQKILMVLPCGGIAMLDPLAVGQLRAALRDAVIQAAADSADDESPSGVGSRARERGRAGA